MQSEESALPLNDKTKALLEQIQDLELMQRSVVECYQAEKRTSVGARLSQQSWRDHAELDSKLTNREFGHLAGAPEYQRFLFRIVHLLVPTQRAFCQYIGEL
jgi:hypothetical protein